MKDILDEVLNGKPEKKMPSNNSYSYQLLKTQINELIRQGMEVDEVIEYLKDRRCYSGEDIDVAIRKIYMRNKQDINDIMTGLKKDNLLTLKTLLEDAIAANRGDDCLAIVRELNRMLPAKIEKNTDGEQITISFT